MGHGCSGSAAIAVHVAFLEVLFAQYIEVSERWWGVADPRQERREFRRRGAFGVLHALVVGGELHREQVMVAAVPVPSQDRAMRDANSSGAGNPCVEAG